MSKANPKRRIRIHMPPGSNTAAGTKVTFLDGEEIPMVLSVTISKLYAEDVPTAFIEMILDELDVEALPFLGPESLARAADLLGMKLVKKDEGE